MAGWMMLSDMSDSIAAFTRSCLFCYHIFITGRLGKEGTSCLPEREKD